MSDLGTGFDGWDWTGGDFWDPSTMGDGWDLPVDLTAFSSIDPSQGGMFYDTLTGQYVTWDQAAALDPEFAQTAYNAFPSSGGGGMAGGNGGAPGGSLPGGGGGSMPGGGGGGTGGLDMNSLLRMLGLGTGLAATGLGAAGVGQMLMGGQNAQNSTATRTTMPGPMSPEQNFLQGILQNTGMQGLAEYGGLGMQQYNMLSALPGMAPSPDANLNAMLTANAMGMAGGGLPALSPELQARLGDIYGARTLDIDRYLDQQSRSVRDQMNNQGWEGSFGDVLRQGPGQALFAPALAEAVRQRGLLAGQQAQSEINLAQSLPTQAAQLGQGVWGQNLGANQNLQQIAGLFNPAMAGRVGLPQNLFNMQNQQRGTTGTETRTGPPPSLYDAFTALGPVLGGLGGSLYSYGQQQPQQPMIGAGNGGGWNPSGTGYI